MRPTEFAMDERSSFMSRTDFLKHLEGLLDIRSGSLKGPENVESLRAWDSLGIVSFLAFLDKEFGVNVSSQALGRCRTVNDLVLLAGSHIHN